MVGQGGGAAPLGGSPGATTATAASPAIGVESVEQEPVSRWFEAAISGAAGLATGLPAPSDKSAAPPCVAGRGGMPAPVAWPSRQTGTWPSDSTFQPQGWQGRRICRILAPVARWAAPGPPAPGKPGSTRQLIDALRGSLLSSPPRCTMRSRCVGAEYLCRTAQDTSVGAQEKGILIHTNGLPYAIPGITGGGQPAGGSSQQYWQPQYQSQDTARHMQPGRLSPFPNHVERTPEGYGSVQHKTIINEGNSYDAEACAPLKRSQMAAGAVTGGVAAMAAMAQPCA